VALGCAAALLAAGIPAVADQRDPRLDSLFAALETESDPRVVAETEGLIWRVWLESGDPQVDRLMQQGIAQMSARALDDAVDTFTEAVRLAPEYAEGWNKRATAHYLNDDFPASVADIQRTLDLEPRHFGAISGMGLILIQRGDPEGALRAFERVLEIHPASPSARLHVERLRALIRQRSA
jgi:Flp pilus assembly protein TadD